MSKLHLLLLPLLIAAAGYAFHLHQELGKSQNTNHDLHRQLDAANTQLLALQAALKKEQGTLNSQEADLRGELESLQSKIDGVNAQIKLFQVELQQLNSTPNAGPGDLNQQLKEATDRRGELEAKIKRIDESTALVKNDQKSQFKQAEFTSSASLIDYAQRIQAQEGVVKDLNTQLNYWRKNRRDPNSVMNIQNLTPQLQAAQQQLADLKQSKIAVQQGEQQSKKNVQVQADRQTADLKEDRERTQELLQTAKNDLAAIQKKLADNKNGNADLIKRRQTLQDSIKRQNDLLTPLLDEKNKLQQSLAALKAREKNQ